MKFDINDYKGKYYVMHCKTEEEAREFCNYLHSIGRKWCNDAAYTNQTYYYAHKDNTVYHFNNGTYGSLNVAIGCDYTILEFSDFDWSKEFTKADLKTGDVVLRRNGSTEIVNRELGMFIRKNGWNDLDEIRENLTSVFNNEHGDIVAVRRPKNKYDCMFNAFERERGTLVYERKEPEEMTLEQVCKLLGKEIKIIKG